MSGDGTPRVSVLMPVYNGEPYLSEAVDSILAQSFADFEFIIVDDGSTDNTWPILQEYAAREPRIVLTRNDANVGLARSLNKGLELAQGEYVARMDADDISLPRRLATQVAFLDEYPDIGVVGSFVQLIDEDGALGAVWHYPTMPGLLLWSLSFHSPLAHPSVVFRRRLVEEVGGYDEALLANQDRDLWHRLSSLTRLSNLPDVLLLYRQHPDTISQRQADVQARNSAQAAQRRASSILGSEVPLHVFRAIQLRRYEDTEVAARALKLVHSLYDVFMAREDISNREKRAIRRDAVQRALSIAWSGFDDKMARRRFFALGSRLGVRTLAAALGERMARRALRTARSKIARWRAH